jgi:thymidylate kinase
MWSVFRKTIPMNVASILEKIGLCAPHGVQDPVALKLHQILNPDGTVRWLWPVGSNHPYFLKFYNIQGWKSKLFSWAVKVVFALRLQGLMFRKATYSVMETSAMGASLLTNNSWALFTGTTGPNRKAILYSTQFGIATFTKIPIGENAPTLLQNELAAVKLLQVFSPITFSFPKVVGESSHHLTLTDVSSAGERSSRLSLVHEIALLEIRNTTAGKEKLNTLPVWDDVRSRIKELEQTDDRRMPMGLIRKLSSLVNEMDSETVVDVCFSHGDFTPWNMFHHQNGGLQIYDWELSRNKMPLGFDAFHFIIQSGILVQRIRWKEIQRQIEDSIFDRSHLFKGYTPSQQALYLKLYLLINTVYYLKVYQQQKEWHTQVSWLINTWNEAISSVLSDVRKNRALVVMDMLDFAIDKRYAILKYDNFLPEHLPAFSDMDICISKDDYPKVGDYLAQHVLVKKRQTDRKSFMASEQLVLKDGTLLSLDFIWQFKRKEKVIMDSISVLKNSSMLPIGVKAAADIDNARYVGFFHALNNAPVPEKYRPYRDDLRSSHQYSDDLLAGYYDGVVQKAAVAGYVTSLRINNGLTGMKHKINYLLDSFRSLTPNRGMVITFSGVDGAGKSTVIENLKLRIEKQLRKRVVVIRHRPSLLPILSAWTKGKAAAEQDAANRLPRQGKNKSSLSSLFRFSYYYLDYIFGQWYVALKYVSRGYVVLYDRYYFDFINDSRRSNINLPSSITRWGYALIREPHINFFLYANPELILMRKKELDKGTIQHLTQQYLTLFRNLNGNRSVQRYVSIENIDLSNTLNLIMGKVAPDIIA